MPVAFDFTEYRISIILFSSLFYGVFLVLFLLSTLILHQQCKRSPSTPLSRTTVYLTFNYLMFLVLTTIWLISAIMSFNPGITYDARLPDDFNPIMFSQTIIGYLAVFIGDSVMAYRLYIIWEQNWVILCIPVLYIFTGIGLTIPIIVHYVRHRTIFFTPNIILVGTSISINIACTVLIAWRVWRTNRLTRAIGGGGILIRLLAIFIESSALYTTWMLTFLATHFISVPASLVFLYGIPHVAGIASMLINVRVGLGWAAGEEGRSTRSLHNSALVHNPLEDNETCQDMHFRSYA